MPPRRPPTLRLRRLGAELRRLREAVGLKPSDVAESTGINATTLYRIENAQVRPQGRTLRDLMALYEVSDQVRTELAELVSKAGEQNWLQSVPADLPSPYLNYIAFEGEATSITNYECMYVPGLLQTEDYARASISADMLTGTDDQVEQLVRVRMARQEALTRDDPLQLWVIVDEGALRRPVGGPAVMANQLAHLAESARRPRVVLQVIPFKVGAHPGMAGAFAVLRFGEPSEVDVVYTEGQGTGLFLEGATDVRRYTKTFEHLRALAMPPADSVSLITDAARTMAANQEGGRP
jgi:transcriptional regulator with XRE-family HTH domain